MEITEWYAISLGALVALFLVCRLFFAAVSAARVFGTLFALKHLLYPQIPKVLRGEGTITRLHSLLILLYVCGNILCVVFRTTSTSQIGARSGLMSLVNLIPLCVGGRINLLVASFCGLSYDNYSRTHRWVGRVAAIQGLTHGAISLTKDSKPELPGLLAAVGIFILLVLSLHVVHRLYHELFLTIHLLSAAATMVILWFHVQSVKIYLIVAISMFVTALALRTCLLFYRNFSHGRFSRGASIKQLPDAVQVSVKVQRPWKFQAGQYIYLYAPGVGYWTWLQSHPFALAWWYREPDGDVTVVLLVQPRKGFTKKLQYASSSIRAFIEGPYGFKKDLGSYGTVIMFATGIGIAGQLLYIKSLLEGHNNRKVRTQRISLHWQVDKECHEEWVSHWMNQLLEQDKHKILDISLYVLGQHCNPVRYGKRLNKWYNPFNAEKIVRDSVKEQTGRIVVAVCTDPDTKDKIRKTVGGILTKNIRFEELDFHPSRDSITCEKAA